MTLQTYTRIAAVVFVVIGLAGFVFASAGYSGFFGPGVPENSMHLFVGLLFCYFGFLSHDSGIVRTFVAVMGVLLLLGKGMLIGANLWGDQNAFAGVTEVACMVAGLSSILAARYLS